MDNHVTIELKLKEQQTLALCSAHLWLMDNYDVENDHETLLYEFLKTMALTLQKRVESYDNVRLEGKGKKFWRLIMQPYEALMFCQLWGPVGLEHLPLANVLIGEIIGKVDRVAKGQRVLQKL